MHGVDGDVAGVVVQHLDKSLAELAHAGVGREVGARASVAGPRGRPAAGEVEVHGVGLEGAHAGRVDQAVVQDLREHLPYHLFLSMVLVIL